MRDALHLTKFANFGETMPRPHRGSKPVSGSRPAGCQKQFKMRQQHPQHTVVFGLGYQIPCF
jgi:hypothetical protein